jgi:hypothetical protein
MQCNIASSFSKKENLYPILRDFPSHRRVEQVVQRTPPTWRWQLAHSFGGTCAEKSGELYIHNVIFGVDAMAASVNAVGFRHQKWCWSVVGLDDSGMGTTFQVRKSGS